MEGDARDLVKQGISYAQFALTKGTTRQALGSLWALLSMDAVSTVFSPMDLQNWHSIVDSMKMRVAKGKVSASSVATFCNTLSSILDRYPSIPRVKTHKRNGNKAA